MTLSLGFFAVSAAPASGPNAPVNDNYVDSLELNRPGKRLNRTDTLKAIPNTANATTQSDIFKPPASGGPPEITTCRGVSYGKTVWYDFYPDSDGNVKIRTSGFDNVITLYRFNRHTLLPGTHQCAHQGGTFPSEELDASVKQGLAYTIQVGGVNGAGGPLQFQFDYFVPPPHRLTADSTLKAQALPSGIKLLGLSVSSARATRVAVDCGRFCAAQSKFGKSVESFPALNGINMPVGSQLHIRVTAPHSIGVYIQYNIVAGNFTKVTRCMEPGSRKPRRKCH